MFCIKCGSNIPNDSEFCQKCGAKTVPYAAPSSETPVSSDEKYTPIPKAAVVIVPDKNNNDFIPRCPNCGSTRFTVTEEKTTHSSGGSFGFSDACCGYILLGPVGLLCGICGSEPPSSHTESKTYCIC